MRILVFLNEQIVSSLSCKEGTVTRTMVLILKQGRLQTHIFAASAFGVQAEQSLWDDDAILFGERRGRA
jgi:hypothetical protein